MHLLMADPIAVSTTVLWPAPDPTSPATVSRLQADAREVWVHVWAQGARLFALGKRGGCGCGSAIANAQICKRPGTRTLLEQHIQRTADVEALLAGGCDADRWSFILRRDHIDTLLHSTTFRSDSQSAETLLGQRPLDTNIRNMNYQIYYAAICFF
jgi:hypothetical protein